MKKLSLLTIFMVSACQGFAGEPIPPICPTTAAITNGVKSTDRRATAMVLLNGRFKCSGVVIGPQTVLTAAHCMENEEYGTNYHIIIDGDGVYEVVDGLAHPDYNKGLAEDDLGFLYTKNNLPGPYASLFPEGEQCYKTLMQGYGRTAFDEDAGILHESPAFEIETTTRIVAYDGPEDSQVCHGDSGGPFYAVSQDGSLYVLTVAARTRPSSCSGGFGYGPNLHYHADWISKNTF